MPCTQLLGTLSLSTRDAQCLRGTRSIFQPLSWGWGLLSPWVPRYKEDPGWRTHCRSQTWAGLSLPAHLPKCRANPSRKDREVQPSDTPGQAPSECSHNSWGLLADLYFWKVKQKRTFPFLPSLAPPRFPTLLQE